MEYYVYMYLDQNSVPFYVGKGKGYRCRVAIHLQNRSLNRLLKNKIFKVGIKNVRTYFLNENLTEEDAFTWERYWIKYIGRRDKKEGTLCNLTDGGEGSSGAIYSEETKFKISLAGKGRPAWNKGKTLSEEHKRKVGEGRKGKKMSEEAKRKIIKALIGRPCSKETRRKIGAANQEHMRRLWQERKESTGV